VDFSNVEFNKNHRAQASAKDAITGLRLLFFGFVANILATAMLAYANYHYWQTAETLPLLVYPGWALMLAGSVSAMYGSYLTASALGWAGWIAGAMIASMLIPYAKCPTNMLSLSTTGMQGFRRTIKLKLTLHNMVFAGPAERPNSSFKPKPRRDAT